MPDRKGPVLVIGATGQQGGATARHLLGRDRMVRALVRDPASPAARALRRAGADLVVGDLDDPASLLTAMKGAHGVFLVLTMMVGPRISPEGVAAEERRGQAVADLARESGIPSPSWTISPPTIARFCTTASSWSTSPFGQSFQCR